MDEVRYLEIRDKSVMPRNLKGLSASKFPR